MRPDLLPLAELVELGARRDQHLAGPVADLGEEDAGGFAVGEEDADGLAGHSRLPALMTRLIACAGAVRFCQNGLFVTVTTPGVLDAAPSRAYRRVRGWELRSGPRPPSSGRRTSPAPSTR